MSNIFSEIINICYNDEKFSSKIMNCNVDSVDIINDDSFTIPTLVNLSPFDDDSIKINESKNNINDYKYSVNVVFKNHQICTSDHNCNSLKSDDKYNDKCCYNYRLYSIGLSDTDLTNSDNVNYYILSIESIYESNIKFIESVEKIFPKSSFLDGIA